MSLQIIGDIQAITVAADLIDYYSASIPGPGKVLLKVVDIAIN